LKITQTINLSRVDTVLKREHIEYSARNELPALYVVYQEIVTYCCVVFLFPTQNGLSYYFQKSLLRATGIAERNPKEDHWR